jgi:hypothetical protein
MGAVADRLLRMLVVTREPAESYAVEEILRGLSDEAAPERLASVALVNKKEGGWTARGERTAGSTVQ